MVEMEKESIVYLLHAEKEWPDREFMPESEAVDLRDRIVNEIQGMDKVPYPDALMLASTKMSWKWEISPW